MKIINKIHWPGGPDFELALARNGPGQHLKYGGPPGPENSRPAPSLIVGQVPLLCAFANTKVGFTFRTIIIKMLKVNNFYKYYF